jgi:hypothetical protein
MFVSIEQSLRKPAHRSHERRCADAGKRRDAGGTIINILSLWG